MGQLSADTKIGEFHCALNCHIRMKPFEFTKQHMVQLRQLIPQELVKEQK